MKGETDAVLIVFWRWT